MAMLPKRPSVNSATDAGLVDAIRQAHHQLEQEGAGDQPQYHASMHFGSKRDTTIFSAPADILNEAVQEIKAKAKDSSHVLYVNTIAFNAVIVFGIAVNVILVGVEIDHDLGVFGNVLHHVLTGFWVVEASLKLFSLGIRSYFADYWNLIDFCLAIVAVFDTWIVVAILGWSQDEPDTTITLRAFRVFRTLQILRTLRCFKQLVLLLSGMWQACITLVWVFLLMFLAIYIAGIMITYIVGKDCDQHQPAWTLGLDSSCYQLYGTLGNSMVTLFQVACLDLEVVRPVSFASPAGFCFLVFFIIFSSFGLINIIMGVMVESVLMSSKINEERLVKAEDNRRLFELRVLGELFLHADADQSGAVTKEEFLVICKEPYIQRLFEDLGMPVSRSTLARRLFEVLDVDRLGALDSQTFQTRATTLKQEGKSLLWDQTMLLMEVRHANRRVERVEGRLAQLHRTMDTTLSCLKQLAARDDEVSHEVPIVRLRSLSL